MAQADKPADSTATVVADTATSASARAASPRKSATAGGKFTLFLALLAFLLAAASAGWQGYQIWLEQFAPGEQPWTDDISRLESRLVAQQRNYQQADAALRDGFGVEHAALAERIQALQGETDSALTQQLQAVTWIKQRQQALD